MIEIEIKIESPVAFEKDNEDIWIYKDPTADEIDEVIKLSQRIRMLTLDNDYYIASAWHFTHKEMARDLYDYTHKTYNSYDTSFIIDKDMNCIELGELGQIIGEISVYNELKKFIPDMISVGLIDNYTYICAYSRDIDIDNMTVKELMETDILKFWK